MDSEFSSLVNFDLWSWGFTGGEQARGTMSDFIFTEMIDGGID